MSILLLLALPRGLAFPMDPYPQCGEQDRPDLCPEDLGEDWAILSYVPESWRANVRSEEHSMGTGIRADRAWRVTAGDPGVVLAVLDSGILWDETDLLQKHWLNADELPAPQVGGVDVDDDNNGDGVFNIDDWAGDLRVSMTDGVDAADGVLDPSDLIAAFSDGVDDDSNGYIDDISGWDFFFNDNDPFDDTRFDHGTYEAQEAARPGEDGSGIGVCPNCMVLSLRVGDSFVADGQSFAAATTYAVDRGASVVQEALGALGNSSYVTAAIDYAWERGVLVVGSAGDETAWHPNPPGANPHTIYVHAISHDADSASESTSFLAYSNCTNHGGRLDLSATSSGCSSGATAMTSGTAGLVLSAARERGISLSAAELYQILVGTADDIWIPGSESATDVYPSYEGWDSHFGAGRINAEAAVAAVIAGEIPPVADILSPEWYAWIDPAATPSLTISGLATADRATLQSWSLEWAPGLEPVEADFAPISSGTTPVDGVLGTWDVSALPGIDPGADLPMYTPGQTTVEREAIVNQYTATLRLSVTDNEGRRGVMRRVVHVRSDPDLLPGWPLRLDSSVEASPVLYDLDGDGAWEVIIADGGGRLHVLHADGSEAAGFPVQVGVLEELDPAAPGNHLGAPAAAILDVDVGEAVIGTPAIGDLDGDGQVEIVVGTTRGSLYVYGTDGAVRPGFPVFQDPVAFTDPDHVWDESFFGAPALGDLDGDGELEIVVPGSDQKVYAFHDDGGLVSGWPVLAAYPDRESVGVRIVSAPAIGDLNADGRDDVVLGNNDIIDEDRSALFAISGDGSFLPGWPIRIRGLFVDALPMVGQGMPGSAALGDVDGDGTLEVIAHALAAEPTVYGADGVERLAVKYIRSNFGEASNMGDNAILPLVNSPSLGDLDGDGLPDIVTGGAGIGYATGLEMDGKRTFFDHGIGAWSGLDGTFLPGFPQQVEDLQFFLNPAIADIDGDTRPEVIASSGGFVVHAWDRDGQAPAGWPKFTGGWLLASPTVGDVDGDGSLDVVTATRSGLVFVWRTPSPAGADVQWAGFGHDAANTHNYESPLPGYNAGYPPTPPKVVVDDGCGCQSPDAAPGAALAAAALLLLRRRKQL